MTLSAVEIGGTLGLRLLLRQIPEGMPLSALQDPFLSLPCPDGLSRWLLGEIASGTGQRMQLVLVSITSDEPGIAPGSLTNPVAEGLWGREVALMAELGQASPGVIPLDPYLDPSGKVRKQRPLFLCKKVRSLFHPACPRCGSILTECREDGVLAQAGLQGFSQGTKRYLWCPGCRVGEPGAPAFYSRSPDPGEKGNPLVTDLAGLLDLWGQTLRVSPSSMGDMPCSGCEHLGTCYAAGIEGPLGASDMISPLSFYDFYLRVSPFFPLSFDACVDLLGGRPVEEVLAGASLLRNPVAEAEFRKASFRLCSYDPGSGGARRVFLQKLGLWIGVLSQVEGIWSKDERPLGSITPGNILVDCLDADLLPGAFPPLKTRLHVYSRITEGLEDQGETTCLAACDPAYMPPELYRREGYSGRFLVESCSPAGAPGTYVVQGLLQPGDLAAGFRDAGGRLAVSLGPSQGFSREFRVTFDIASFSSRGLRLSSTPVELSDRDLSVFQLLSSQPAFTVSCRPVPASPYSLDLFALGMIGARIFLVNKGQDLPTVAEALLALRRDLVVRPVGEEGLFDATRSILESREGLAATQLMWEPGGRDDPGIQEAWEHVICSILELISLSSRPAGLDGREPRELIGGLVRELTGIASVLASGPGPVPVKRVPRDAGLAALLDRLLQDTSWLTRRKELPPEGKGPAVAEAGRADTPPVEAGGPVDSLEETVVLGGMPGTHPGEGHEEGEVMGPSDEEVEETIIMPPRDRDD